MPKSCLLTKISKKSFKPIEISKQTPYYLIQISKPKCLTHSNIQITMHS
uniref:Uncharacterized protein n=1 Tax=Anguilla anguilla TaxID=7936 RepID=A0A0E9W7Z9_ANGAN